MPVVGNFQQAWIENSVRRLSSRERASLRSAAVGALEILGNKKMAASQRYELAQAALASKGPLCTEWKFILAEFQDSLSLNTRKEEAGKPEIRSLCLVLGKLLVELTEVEPRIPEPRLANG
jgi:hypothetical protein